MPFKTYFLLPTLALAWALQIHLQAQIGPQQRLVMDLLPSLHAQHALPSVTDAPFLAYSLSWTGPPQSLNIRFGKPDGTWSPWNLIEIDGHLGDPAREYQVSRLYILENETATFFQVTAEKIPSGIKIHFYNPGRSVLRGPGSTSAGASATESCPQPDHVLRNGWCGENNCPGDSTPQPTEVSHIIIHHSAGTNSANNWAAIVRAIWDLHVNTNGWDDIGYNWLIDPQGVIYEGRADHLQGAHFCSKNSFTTGVCLLGTFTNQAPTDEAIESLKRLLAWKSTERDIDPAGMTFHPPSEADLGNISGHRDGCNTACPGNMFYPLIDQIRVETAEQVESGCRLSTGTLQGSASLSASIFPNPAKETATIRLRNIQKGNLTVTLYTSGGETLKKLYPARVSGRELLKLDLTDISSGIYFLKIADGRNSITKKLVLL